MNRRALALRLPVKTFAIALAAAIGQFVLVGIPGPCGMSGLLGDALVKNDIVFWLSYAVLLASLAAMLLAALIVRVLPGSRAQEQV